MWHVLRALVYSSQLFQSLLSDIKCLKIPLVHDTISLSTLSIESDMHLFDTDLF